MHLTNASIKTLASSRLLRGHYIEIEKLGRGSLVVRVNPATFTFDVFFME